MKKKHKIPYGIIGAVIIIAFLIWSSWPIKDSNIEEDFFSNVSQLHWDHMPLTYSITDHANCGELQINKMLEALEILENETGYIKFVETNETNPDLEIQCLDLSAIRDSYLAEIDRLKNSSKLNCIAKFYDYEKNSISTYEEGILNKSEHLFISAKKQSISPNTIWNICYLNLSDINWENIEDYNAEDWGDISKNVVGDARPNFIGNIITDATINLYAPDEGWVVCSKFPSKEMHELLHVFGFTHSYEPYWDPYYGYSDWSYAEDIMFPYIYCPYQTEIQTKYVSCLKYVYSNGQEGFCSSDLFYSHEDLFGGCASGWYPVENSDYCCPEPNMTIENGYCV